MIKPQTCTRLTEEVLLSRGFKKVDDRWEFHFNDLWRQVLTLHRDPHGEEFKVSCSGSWVYLSSVEMLDMVFYLMKGEEYEVLDKVFVKRDTGHFKEGEEVTIIHIVRGLVCPYYHCENAEGKRMPLTEHSIYRLKPA